MPAEEGHGRTHRATFEDPSHFVGHIEVADLGTGKDGKL
jgi:hypothetical protein